MSCNARVELVEKKAKLSDRVTYHKYSPVEHAAIGKYATVCGVSAACKHFKPILRHNLPEPTAHKFKNVYVNDLQKRKRETHPEEVIPAISELPPKKRSRPLLLGEYNSVV